MQECVQEILCILFTDTPSYLEQSLLNKWIGPGEGDMDCASGTGRHQDSRSEFKLEQDPRQ